jgi:hypothetical protein
VKPQTLKFGEGKWGRDYLLTIGQRTYYSVRQTYLDSLFRDVKNTVPLPALLRAGLPKYIFRHPIRTLTDRQRVASLLFRLIMRLVDSGPKSWSLNLRMAMHAKEFHLLWKMYHTKYWCGPSMRLHRTLKAKFALILGFPLSILEVQGGSLETYLT